MDPQQRRGEQEGAGAQAVDQAIDGGVERGVFDADGEMAGLELGQQLFDGPLYLREFLYERRNDL